MDRKIERCLVELGLAAGMLLASCASLPATQATPGMTERPGTNTPEEVAVTAPSSAQEISSDAYVVLFRNVVAGDYSVVSLNTKGNIELIGWNRLNQITAYKKGDISADEAAAFFKLFGGNEFQGLGEQYDIYPLPENSTIVYEDIYYILKLYSDGVEKYVLAHEQVIPAGLQAIITPLQSLVDQMPEMDLQGNFVLSGDHDVLGFKRLIQQGDLLEIDEQATQYPLLIDSLNHPFSLVPADNLAGSGLAEVLNEENRSLAVIYKQEYFDILLLAGH